MFCVQEHTYFLNLFWLFWRRVPISFFAFGQEDYTVQNVDVQIATFTLPSSYSYNL